MNTIDDLILTIQKFQETLTFFNEDISTYEHYSNEILSQLNSTNNSFEEYENNWNELNQILDMNENILNYENIINEEMTETLTKCVDYFWKLKQNQTKLKNKMNRIIDKMMHVSKMTNSVINRKEYKQKKKELKLKYYETEEFKQKQKEKQKKREEKKQRIELEKQMNDIFGNCFEMKERNENDESETNALKLKIILIGDIAVGTKTSLARRYVNETFSQMTLPTLGCDHLTKMITKRDILIQLSIWDINGSHETFNSTFFNEADGIILGYDITNEKTFKSLSFWLESTKNEVSIDCCKILVGGKCDLEEDREISKEEGKEFADKMDMKFFEVSSSQNINVNECFDELIDSILDIRMKNEKNIIPQQQKNERKKQNEECLEKSNKYQPIVVRMKLENWTKKIIHKKIFDTKYDNWNINNCLLQKCLFGKSQLLFFIDEGTFQFGCFLNSVVNNENGKYISDSNCFVYSLNRNLYIPIIDSKYAIKIHSMNEDKLITIGKEDIVLFKQEKKHQCYCQQISFKEELKRSLIRKEGKNNLFELKRLVIFEMI